MNRSPQDPHLSGPVTGSFSGSLPDSGPDSYQATLRLIANPPVPEGLEDRLRRTLRAAPRQSHLLAWPAGLKPQLKSHADSPHSTPFAPGWIAAWSRAAAATAIGLVVVGGGWGVYSHVERGQARNVIVFPHAAVSGGFSSAGAMRTPETLNGPIVVHPLKPDSAQARPKPVRPRTVPASHRAITAPKPAAQPSPPSAN